MVMRMQPAACGVDKIAGHSLALLEGGARWSSDTNLDVRDIHRSTLTKHHLTNKNTTTNK